MAGAASLLRSALTGSEFGLGALLSLNPPLPRAVVEFKSGTVFAMKPAVAVPALKAEGGRNAQSWSAEAQSANSLSLANRVFLSWAGLPRWHLPSVPDLGEGPLFLLVAGHHHTFLQFCILASVRLDDRKP